MSLEPSASAQFIKLDQFLKYMQIAQTGGQAKLIILNGEVEVNGERELRRGRKLFSGDVVTIDDMDFEVRFE